MANQTKNAAPGSALRFLLSIFASLLLFVLSKMIGRGQVARQFFKPSNSGDKRQISAFIQTNYAAQILNNTSTGESNSFDFFGTVIAHLL